MKRATTVLAGITAITALVLTGCSAKQAGTPSGAEDISSMSLLAQRIGEKSSAKQGAHVTMSVEGAGQSIKAQGDMRFGDSPAMDIAAEIPEMAEITMRFVDNAFYFKLPDEIQPGKPWVKIDVNGNDPMSKALGAAVKQLKDNGDPAQTLKQLEKAGQITGKKTEQVNGKELTHYSVTVDVKKLVDSQGDADLKKLMDEAAKAGIQNFPLELWVDSENLPAKITMDMPFNDPTTQKASQVKLVVEYTDWGKQVNVTAPAPGEVAELPR
jgi:hypothetical protein